MASPNRFDNRRLREESLKAFVKALHTDRMVAVTGAMSTCALGYPSWDEFVQAYALVAEQLAKKIRKDRTRAPRSAACFKQSRSSAILTEIEKRVHMLRTRTPERKKYMDARVGLWSLHELFRTLDAEMRHLRAGLVIDLTYQEPALKQFEQRVASIFRSRTLGNKPLYQEPSEAAIRPLIESLGIKRIATLNYDLELERAFMLRGDEREILKVGDAKATEKRRKKPPLTREEGFAARATEPLGPLSTVEQFIGEAESGKPIVRLRRNRLSRTMGNGVSVESDIVDRERPDRLFEFAVGSAETDRHILHLHGRADVPESMVANIRQYDRLYRLDDLYRDPFDHGLRVLVGGNPLLFVGVGMTEAELNATLEYFVSNVPVRRPAPTFVIWNTNDREGDEKTRFMEDRRLDFRIRLGVHLIFDEDIRQRGDSLLDKLRTADWPEAEWEILKLKAMARTLAALPSLVARVDRRAVREDEWRAVEPRFVGTAGRRRPGPYRILGAKRLAGLVKDRKRPLDFSTLETREAPRSEREVIVASAPSGYGRGELGEQLIQMKPDRVVLDRAVLPRTTPDNRLLVNAGFSYDADAVLNGIASFLKSRARNPLDGWPSRDRMFADGSLFDTRDNVLVVINGADRYFGFDGTPLSVELDHMLRCALQRGGSVRFLLLGTDRLRPYCEDIGIELQVLPSGALLGLADSSGSGSNEDSPERPHPATEEVTEADRRKLPSRYFNWVASRFDEELRKRREALERSKKITRDPDVITKLDIEFNRARFAASALVQIDRAVRIELGALNRAFFEAYLSPALLGALQVDCPAAFEVLRTMCFIGAPIEAAVLLHAPKVRAILAENSELGETSGTDLRDAPQMCWRLRRVIRDLRSLGLLIELDPHQPGMEDAEEPEADDGKEFDSTGKRMAAEENGAPRKRGLLSRRFGLHRSLATFLRDRHGAPINDAKLATTFNMSLFMSEPSDNYTPEPDFHDELGQLVDSLIGGWHDIPVIYGDRLCALPDSVNPEKDDEDFRLLHIHWDEADNAREQVAFRSSREAAACLRSALSVVRGYYSTGALLKLDRGDRIATAERDGALTEHAQRLDRLINGFGDISIARKIARRRFSNDKDALRHMGPDPFYADDLVWLYNERGIVALSQGHLFDAREAFSAARDVNGRTVERKYEGHNWRRIALNLAATYIERGMLKPAEAFLERIDGTINAAAWLADKSQGKPHRVEAIRKLFRESDEGPRIRGNLEFTREEMMMVGMTTGYRGLVAHMRGRSSEAKEYFEDGINILRRLGEQRAYAHFQRHFATLISYMGDKKAAAREINFAINAAQSAKQMDILHRSRVFRASLMRHTSTDPGVLKQALQDVKDALQYAALSDCYRVRIEASANLARHMRHSGDYDTALRYATDALTIASRYGHSLQKTLLRIEIGQILKARGDPRSGEALLKQAIAIGTSKGYHQALEHVRRASHTTPPMPNRTDISIAP